MRERHLVLSPFPQSFRDPAHPLPANAHFYRPVEILQSTTPAPEWSSVLPGSPTVHLTLGTVFNTESGDLLARLVSSLRALPANLIVTSGPGIEPAELGPQPAHVHVAQFVPQASILPYCDGVVSHGGSGSVIAALAHGLPSLLIPLGADQPHNGDRCADLGVARVLPATALTPNIIRAAVGEMLDDSRMRRNAERIRDEIAALPDVRSVVGPLEALVRR
jgi:MGT family glycosyltransferase